MFGYHVTGSTGTLFLYGIVVGALGLLGLSLLLAGARRTSRRGREARRGLTQSRRETAAVSQDRDDLLDQRETARAYTASTLGNARPPTAAIPAQLPTSASAASGTCSGPDPPLSRRRPARTSGKRACPRCPRPMSPPRWPRRRVRRPGLTEGRLGHAGAGQPADQGHLHHTEVAWLGDGFADIGQRWAALAQSVSSRSRRLSSLPPGLRGSGVALTATYCGILKSAMCSPR